MGLAVLVAVVLIVLIVLRIRDQKIARQRNVMGTATEIADDNTRVFCPSWVVLDVETTGLKPETDRVIEFAAIRYRDGVVESKYQTLICPCRPVSKEITALTGLRNQDLRKAPYFYKVAPEICAFIDGLPVVAHNAKFDVGFLLHEFARIGIAPDIQYIDTVRMARWCFYGMDSYKLSDLIREFNLLDHDQDHRAMSDVEATAKLYLLCRRDREYRQRLINEKRKPVS